MSSLATAIEKTNTLIEKVGFNLEKFSKGINDTFEKYLAQKTASEKQVEVMNDKLQENITIELNTLIDDIIPEDISAKQLTQIKMIIVDKK